MNFALNSFLMAAFGITVEVIFTAITKSRNRFLKGQSYIWMIPIYGSSYLILEQFYQNINQLNFLARGLIYAAAIMIVEYLSGWALRKLLGKCPWEDDYKNKKWSINNLVRLDFAPFWIFFSLILERLYLYLPK